MKLVVGLGNPGIEYQFTPHNLGFLVIDRLAQRCGVDVNSRRCQAATGKARIAGHEVLLAKPETYMNLSGLSVRKLVEDLDLSLADGLIVVYDELDLPFGSTRIRQRGGTAGHNGVESLVGSLGSDEFIRIRLGIQPDHPVRDGAKYVLAQFKKSQLEAVDDLVERGADAVETILKDGLGPAMNRFNQRPKTEQE
ncbi:MAG: aminoacyl-tRNA hydrolase [Acidobacteria bacterium]|nr:aminoacyl-tRNA hydrolase [Acidobacteriota bacterium]MBV9146134.1 aminoacyl-tRNA hydrolase [Acidobacteriota bacterium]MBV9435279.1 aminoacyl-tRNA hydrolase [Acidobacteriota bacterium]